MSFAVVMEGMTLIAFLVVIVGGKQKRDSGWRIVSGLLLLVALIQCTAMALVVRFSDLFTSPFVISKTADEFDKPSENRLMDGQILDISLQH